MERARTQPRRWPLFIHVAGLALVGLCSVGEALAQTARKPSPYEYRQQDASAPARVTGPDYLERIDSRAQFMQLARVYNTGTALEMPHLIFVIDRRNSGRIYYINTPRHALHQQFVRNQRLLPGMTKATLNAQYRDPQRRFLFGTVSWQRDLPGYTYEFWEGDQLTAALLRQTDQVLHASFRDAIRFKTNSTQHEQLARSVGLPFISQEALLPARATLPSIEYRPCRRQAAHRANRGSTARSFAPRYSGAG